MFNRNRHYRKMAHSEYEQGIDKRLRPHQLQRFGLYALRMLVPPDTKELAVETSVTLLNLFERSAERWVATFEQHSLEGDGSELIEADVCLNGLGFVILENVGPGRFEGLPKVVEFGYMAGATGSNGPTIVEGIAIPNDISDLQVAEAIV